jgi:hypothetical protein
VKATGQQTEQAIFLPLHLAADCGSPVIETAQVQHAVDDIPHQLGLPARAKTPGLADGFVHADEDFAVQRRTGVAPVSNSLQLRGWRQARRLSYTVVKRDHIRRAGAAKERFVQPHHLWLGDEVNAEFAAFHAEEINEQRTNDAAKQGQVDASGALAIPQH